MNVQVERIEGKEIFRTLEERAKDLRKPFFDEILPLMYADRVEEFDRQAYHGKSGWEAWTPFKVKPKGTSRGAGGRFTARKLLNRTGRMRRAVTSFAAPSTVEVTADSMTLRSHIDYEEYHQEGTSTIPQRKFGRFEDPALQDKALRILAAYVIEGVDPTEADRVLRGG